MKVSYPLPCEKISSYVDRILVIEEVLVTSHTSVYPPGTRPSGSESRGWLARFLGRSNPPTAMELSEASLPYPCSGFVIAEKFKDVGGADGLVLANPWTIEETSAAAEPEADSLRAHYRQRLRDPKAMLRLLKGGVKLGPLLRSLAGAARPSPPSSLAAELKAGLAGFGGPVTILLAGRDRTAQTFLARWDKADPRLRHCPQASHSFVEPEARDWLAERLLEALSA